ncbi:MAG: hypothetical protein QOI56_1964 [Actinomycetota bacterium]|jgi:hypothetical protein|nr:hypothetical protein [Actinomycetota bacterium]MEA2933179.1 hypothetical protein [Actinomycetota bacterium]
MAQNTLNLNVLGFPQALPELRVEVRDPITSRVVKTAKPYLDGSVRIAGLDAGAYQLAVIHDNLATPVLRRPIRVLPSGDTRVSVVIDPSLFRNTPIQDIPDANLGPARDTVESVAETVLPLTHKQPGEAIRSDDWNAMAGAIHDLATAVAELTRVVSPSGHDHPELSAKFDEVTGNFGQLVNTISSSMTELQRQIQAQRYRNQVDDLIDRAGDKIDEGASSRLRNLVGSLEANVTESPLAYGRRSRDVGVQLTAEVSRLLEHAPELAQAPEVDNVAVATDRLRSQQATTYKSELEFHRATDRALGAGGLASFRKER